MKRSLLILVLAGALSATSSDGARWKFNTAVDGRFSALSRETVTAGEPFSAEGWTSKLSARGAVRWAIPQAGETAVEIGPGCAIVSAATLEKGLHYFVAANIYGWDGKGPAPCSFSIEDPGRGKVYMESPQEAGSATFTEMSRPVCALGPHGPAPAAIDGDLETDWICEVSAPLQQPWLLIDLGEERTVGGIRLAPSTRDRGDSLTGFRVCASKGSYNWQTLALGELAETGRPEVLMFAETVTNRYFRIDSKSAVDGGGRLSLAEVEILGDDGKPLPPRREGPSVKRLYFTLDGDISTACDGRELNLVLRNSGSEPVVVGEVMMVPYPARGYPLDAAFLGFKGVYWNLEPFIAVDEVRADMPADKAGLRRYDLITGINGRPFPPSETNSTAGWFMRSLESTLGRAVVAALLAGESKISLTVLRDGRTLKIPVGFPDAPAFTDSFPYDCPMVAAMRRDMARFSAAHLQERGLPRSARGVIPSSYAFLAVLGSRDPGYGPLLQNVVHEALAESRNGIGLNAWYNGAVGTALCEYYLATGDDAVLPWIEETLEYFPQTADYSKWGPAIYGHHPNSLPYGGKSLIAPSIHMLAFDALGSARMGMVPDRAGLRQDTWDTIKAYVDSGWSDPGVGGYGGQGYGYSPARRQSWFRTGGVALAAEIRGNKRLSWGRMPYMNEQHWAMRDSHAYGPQGATWGLLGLAITDPEGFRSIMHQYAWHFVLSWEPGYGLRSSRYHMGCSYMPPDVIFNGGYGAVFSAVEKGLHVTGATDRNWLEVPQRTYASKVYIQRDSKGLVSFRTQLPAAEIRYTLDGTEPTPLALQYQEPFPLPEGGLVSVRSFDKLGQAGPVNAAAYGSPRNGWTITRRLPKHLFSQPFDGDPYTYYETPRTTQWCRNVPHHINISFGRDVPLLGLRILPRLDNVRDVAIEKCSLLAVTNSTSGKARVLAETEFSDGGGDILMDRPITTSSIVFSVDRTRGDRAWSSFAEIYPVTPDPEIFWNSDNFGVEMRVYDGYPVRYTNNGAIPDAQSPLYKGETIQCAAGDRIIGRLVTDDGWLGKPIVYQPRKLMVQGLERREYLGASRKDAALDELDPDVIAPVESIHCNNTARSGNYALKFTGRIDALEDLQADIGVETRADDFVLYIDGRRVLDNRDRRSRPRSAATTVDIEKGSHDFRLEFWHGKGPASLDFNIGEAGR